MRRPSRPNPNRAPNALRPSPDAYRADRPLHAEAKTQKARKDLATERAARDIEVAYEHEASALLQASVASFEAVKNAKGDEAKAAALLEHYKVQKQVEDLRKKMGIPVEGETQGGRNQTAQDYGELLVRGLAEKGIDRLPKHDKFLLILATLKQHQLSKDREYLTSLAAWVQLAQYLADDKVISDEDFDTFKTVAEYDLKGVT